MAKKQFARICTACKKGMNEGYCINDGEAYYCGEACLGDYCTQEEWEELYADGEGDSYWTDWSEDPDNFEDEDEDEVDNNGEQASMNDINALRQRVEALAADPDADALERIEALEQLVAALDESRRVKES